ncbi:MAG: PAS domain-containing protein, partial [Candidatus Omnitrophica bacterium]|nr:PAS domain-containing protein [Candidatus Omnitrophota bacterium]
MKKEKNNNDKLKTLEIYKRIINFTKEGIFSYTVDQGKILFANQGLVDILDLESKPKDLIGKKIGEIIEYTQEPGTVRKKLKKEGQVYNLEYNFKTLSGQNKWVVHNAFLREEDGRKIVEAVIRDITYQKKIEKEILFNQFVLDHMSNPVLWITSEGDIDYVNQAAIDILDYSKEE